MLPLLSTQRISKNREKLCGKILHNTDQQHLTGTPLENNRGSKQPEGLPFLSPGIYLWAGQQMHPVLALIPYFGV
jgi:hypothetical protein